MNFEYMPELHWKYGYFVLLGRYDPNHGELVYLFRRKELAVVIR